MLNLTDNAVKYNQEDGTVSMGLQRREGRAEFFIANTGPGIPPEKLPRVFDRFYRGDPSHSGEIEGAGLGLSIAEWVVKAHGGTIRIDSTPGQQTGVRVSLPLGE